ncbi:MAG: hypothetical protein WC061_11375, partial [Melioribacteraceae bacterium]
MLNMLLIIASLTGLNNLDNPNTEVKRYSSRAFNLKDGMFLYSEFHEEKFKGDKITASVTKYKDPKNNLLSERIMTFEQDLTKPKFVLKDYRS